MFEPPFRIKNMMPGMIMLWYGSVATIPAGWTLCNGTNGTPNLTAKFVLGAGFPVPPPGATGGSASHTHDFTGDGHAHGIPAGQYIPENYPTDGYGHTTDSTPSTGTTDSKDGRPPYHALCYIMKTPIP